MAVCNPNELAKDASCFFCLTPGYYYPVKLAILARILKALDPGADTSPAGLMADAAAACIACPPQGELGPIKLALICDATGGGGAVPIPPSNLTIDLTSTDTDVIPTWTNNGGATNIEVWKSVNGGAYALYATIGGAATNYHDPVAINPTDYWEYQVRAIGTGGPSAFSNKAGVADVLGISGTANVSMPFLVLCLNGMSIGNPDPVLLTVSFPELLKITSFPANLSNNANLTSISMPKLQSVTGGAGIDCSNDSSLITIDFSSLVTVGGDLLFGATACNANFPALTSAGNITFSSSSAGTFSAQALVTASALDFSASSFATVSFGALTSATGLNFTNCNNLSSVSFTLLASVTGNIDFSLCPTLLGLQFPALTTVTGFFNGSETPSLATASFPSLATVGGTLNFSQSAGDGLAAWSLPALTSVGGDFNFGGTSAASFTANVLTTIGGAVSISSAPNLASLSCSSLVSVASTLVFLNNALTSVNFNSLQTVGNDLNGSNNPLAAISFPALTTVPKAFNFSSCTNLVNVSIPLVIFTDTGDPIDFTGDKVAAGVSGSGTGVNGILARGVASGVTVRDFELTGGTNTGISGLSAQGTADLGTLTTAGNTMNLNP